MVASHEKEGRFRVFTSNAFFFLFPSCFRIRMGGLYHTSVDVCIRVHRCGYLYVCVPVYTASSAELTMVRCAIMYAAEWPRLLDIPLH